MIYILGHKVDELIVTEANNRVCRRSGDDHLKLKFEAWKARKDGNFDVENSHVLCLRCGLAIALKSADELAFSGVAE